MKRIVFALFAVSLCLSSALAQDPLAERLDAYLDAHVEASGFMGNVLVAQGDAVLFAQSYGASDLERALPNDSQSVFRIGSVTKQFTAAAILRLQQEGRLAVTDPLSTYVPDYPHADRITLHQLLSHSAGVPNYTSLPDFVDFADEPHTTDTLIDRFRHLDLDFEPGSRFTYSNSGYVLLAAVIERVTGLSYGEYLQASILGPLGMHDTAVEVSTEIVPNGVRGYGRSRGELVPAMAWDATVASAGGALLSTTDDLLVWARALASGMVVAPEAWASMTAPAVTVDAATSYGYGMFVGQDRGRDVAFHSGGTFGFAAATAMYPAEDLTVVVLSNVEQAPSPSIASDLAAIALGDHVDAPRVRTAVALDEDVLAAYEGRYELAPDLVATIALDGDLLTLDVPGQGVYTLQAEAVDAFFLQEVDVQLTFDRDGGLVTGIVVHQGGQQLPGARVN